MDKVIVLMTAYNPREYILEQIDSILSQKDVEVEIIIRDDNSTEKEWIKKIPKRKNIILIEGRDNLGVRDNILSLLQYAYDNKKGNTYFAYSDQDDFWLPEKLNVAVNNLKKLDNSKACLYYSNLYVVDENLNNGRYLFKKSVVKNTLGQALSQIFEFACTSVFNYMMIEELLKEPMDFMGIDHMLYYISIIKGSVAYDDESYILYRQHGTNVSGQKLSGIQYFVKKTTEIINPPKDNARAGGGSFKQIAQYLLEHFENAINSEQRDILNKVATYDGMISRIRIIFDKRIRAGYQPKDFYRAIRLILNRY